MLILAPHSVNGIQSIQNEYSVDQVGIPCDTSKGLNDDALGTIELGLDSDSDSELGTEVNCENQIVEDYPLELYGLGSMSDCWAITNNVCGPYLPVQVLPRAPRSFLSRSCSIHRVGGIPTQLKLDAWIYELSFENDPYLKAYIENGIRSGFRIVDHSAVVAPYHCRNYRSVLVEPAYSVINDLILRELHEGKYVVAEGTPICVHALGAVKKGDGSLRPITDCRRPESFSINNHVLETHQTFAYITQWIL